MVDRDWEKGVKRAKKWLSKAEHSKKDEKALSYSLLAAAELRRLGVDKKHVYRMRLSQLLVVVVFVIGYILIMPSFLQDNIFLIKKKSAEENRVYFAFTPSYRDLGDIQFWQYVKLPSVETEKHKTSDRASYSKKVKKVVFTKSNEKKKVFTSKFQMIRLVEVGIKELYKQKGAFIMKKGGN